VTTADGTVVGMTQIRNSGPRATHWNLAITGDGYRAVDLVQFATDANNLLAALLATPPFNTLGHRINAFRIDVRSTDAGADDSTACGGLGTTAATYFDARFCGDGTIRRLLVVDSNLVLDVVDDFVPESNAVLVLVNSTIYGGSGDGVGTMSLAPSANLIGIHELGHTAFGLADEYEYRQGCRSGELRNRHPGPEPVEPNVTTRALNLGQLKWRDLVTPATTIPTTTNGNCAVCDPQPNPGPAATVGAFEGADTWHCGAFRPQFNCMMRTLGSPFCAVCSQQISMTLNPPYGGYPISFVAVGHDQL
jgi:hypothetical protein